MPPETGGGAEIEPHKLLIMSERFSSRPPPASSRKRLSSAGRFFSLSFSLPGKRYCLFLPLVIEYIN